MSDINFTCEFGLKISEIDVFSDGCQLDGGSQESIELSFNGATVDELLTQIKKYFNVKSEYILLNSCDEIGRIDVQTYTKTLNGGRNRYEELKQGFMNGEYNLYFHTFIGEICTAPIPVDLSEYA